MPRIKIVCAGSLVLAVGLLTAGCGSIAPSRTYTAIVNGERVAPPDIAMGDPAIVERIIQIGLDDNRVMDHLSHLSEDIGPRLTGSSKLETANKWVRDTYIEWGLDNPEIEQWGTIPVRFDREPSTAQVVTSRVVTDENGKETVEYTSTRDMAFTTLAWAPGTDGPVAGRVVRMPADEAEYNAVKDQLAGAWILIPTQRRAGQRGLRSGAGVRYRQRNEARQRLAEGNITQVPEPAPPTPAPKPIEYSDSISGVWNGTMSGGPIPDGAPFTLILAKGEAGVMGDINFPGFEGGKIADVAYNEEKGSLDFKWTMSMGDVIFNLFARNNGLEGKAVSGDLESNFTIQGKRGETVVTTTPADTGVELAILDRVLLAEPAGFMSSSGDERVWTSSVSGWRSLNPANTGGDVEIIISEPDYASMNSRLFDGEQVTVQVNANNVFTPGPIPLYNTIAEIKGSVWPEQVVIISAHLDSWNGQGSMGTVDNGTGSAVTMEAARLLMASGAQPKRTIRFIHWTGEEQGLLGSRAYVEMHKDEILANVSLCLVDDGGTNYEGGIQIIEPMRDYFAAATAPLNDVFYSETDGQFLNVDVQVRNSMPRGGGSDHASFNAVGVPGFFWNEIGRANYRYAWHTQNDRIDQAIPEYLRQSATCAAVTAYNLACAPEMLPREGAKDAQE
jgi:Peptidase family M28